MSHTATRLKEMGVVLPRREIGAARLVQAMNGASNLVSEPFGAKGTHARRTVGVSYPPLNALAEVEAIFEIAA